MIKVEKPTNLNIKDAITRNQISEHFPMGLKIKFS